MHFLPKHECQFSIPRTDHSIFRKDNRLRPFLWLGNLHKHTANHEGIDDRSKNRLDYQQKNRFWTFVGNNPRSIANCHLGFDGVEKGRGKGIDSVDTNFWGDSFWLFCYK